MPPFQGFLWNFGNVGSMLAVASPLGLTVGYPLCQCALLIGGCWGIFYFKEITERRAIVLFFVSAMVLLSGATLMALFGKCSEDV